MKKTGIFLIECVYVVCFFLISIPFALLGVISYFIFKGCIGGFDTGERLWNHFNDKYK